MRLASIKQKWEKIFKSGEASPTIKKGAENTTSTSKGATIGEIEQLAKQEKYSILEKIGKENHIKNYFTHSSRVVKQNRKFLKEIAEEGGQEALEELTEEGFEQAADQGLEILAKETIISEISSKVEQEENVFPNWINSSINFKNNKNYLT